MADGGGVMPSRFHRAIGASSKQTPERLAELGAAGLAREEMLAKYPTIANQEDVEAALAFFNRRTAELLNLSAGISKGGAA